MSMASRYVVRYISKNEYILRLAQFVKEEVRGAISHKLLIFMPDSTSNILFGSAQSDYRWVSGIML